jgi:transcriptional regulator with XRE-family HTH domain
MINQIRLGARLRAARKAAGFKTSKDLSKKHKVPESTYSQHESGARQPNDETLKVYGQIFGVNFKWLKTGEGQPYSITTKAKRNIIAEELIELKPINPREPKINQKLLNEILQELFKSSHLNIPSSSIDKISKAASKAYIKALLSNTV